MARNDYHGAFRNFRKLRTHGPRIFSQLRGEDGELITDQTGNSERWRGHFSSLLNRPPARPCPELEEEARHAVPSPLADVSHPTLAEVVAGVGSLKLGRAPGVCGISPEMLVLGDPVFRLRSGSFSPWFGRPRSFQPIGTKASSCLSTRARGTG